MANQRIFGIILLLALSALTSCKSTSDSNDMTIDTHPWLLLALDGEDIKLPYAETPKLVFDLDNTSVTGQGNLQSNQRQVLAP